MGTTLVVAPAVAADPHHPLTGKELLQSCVADLNANRLQVHRRIAGPPSSATPPSFNQANQSACQNFGWTEFTVLPLNTKFTVTARFGGPNIKTSAWDCNHSSVTYGVYQWQDLPAGIPDQWAYSGGGIMYGRLSGGTCVYDVNNSPSQASWGQNSVSTASSWLSSKFRVATHSWAHNDTGFSHPGTLCAAKSCVWSTRLDVTLG